jgi:hypothetical protein
MGQPYARRRGALGSPLLPTRDVPTRSTATVTRADRTPRQRSWAGSAHSSARRGDGSPLEARPLAPRRRSAAAGRVGYSSKLDAPSSKLDAPSSAHWLIPLAPCRKANPCGGITASAGVRSAGDRQSSIRCPAFNSCRQLPHARPTGDLALVERVRLRCPMVTKLSLCPATSQRARQHRMADRAAFRRFLAGKRPFTDSRPVNTQSISGRVSTSAMQESRTLCKAVDCTPTKRIDRTANDIHRRVGGRGVGPWRTPGRQLPDGGLGGSTASCGASVLLAHR